jgi:hypothetical protein
MKLPLRRWRRPGQPQSRERLRLLVCSDLRVQSIPALIRWIGERPTRSDVIVYAGDDTWRFRPTAEVNYWTELAACSTYGVVAVYGNDLQRGDPPIEGERVFDLGKQSVAIEGYAFHGIEGGELEPKIPCSAPCSL